MKRIPGLVLLAWLGSALWLASLQAEAGVTDVLR